MNKLSNDFLECLIEHGHPDPEKTQMANEILSLRALRDATDEEVEELKERVFAEELDECIIESGVHPVFDRICDIATIRGKQLKEAQEEVQQSREIHSLNIEHAGLLLEEIAQLKAELAAIKETTSTVEADKCFQKLIFHSGHITNSNARKAYQTDVEKCHNIVRHFATSQKEVTELLKKFINKYHIDIHGLAKGGDSDANRIIDIIDRK